MIAAKVCRSCRLEKPAFLFPRNARVSDGLSSWCKACHAEAVRRSPSYIAKLGGTPHPCVTCGTTTESRRKYCSPSCIPSRIPKRKPRLIAVCPTCEQTFTAPRSDSTYCSKRCAPSWRTSSDRYNARRMAERAKQRGSCLECGKAWAGRKRKFCSLACQVEYHRSHERHAYRARLHLARVERVSRQRVFERDQRVCQLCYAPVDLSLRGPEGPSLDHIIPLSRGGEHSYANVQLAHFRCNSRKGARAA